jgi:hypothetical protein
MAIRPGIVDIRNFCPGRHTDLIFFPPRLANSYNHYPVRPAQSLMNVMLEINGSRGKTRIGQIAFASNFVFSGSGKNGQCIGMLREEIFSGTSANSSGCIPVFMSYGF